VHRGYRVELSCSPIGSSTISSAASILITIIDVRVGLFVLAGVRQSLDDGSPPLEERLTRRPEGCETVLFPCSVSRTRRSPVPTTLDQKAETCPDIGLAGVELEGLAERYELACLMGINVLRHCGNETTARMRACGRRWQVPDHATAFT